MPIISNPPFAPLGGPQAENLQVRLKTPFNREQGARRHAPVFCKSHSHERWPLPKPPSEQFFHTRGESLVKSSAKAFNRHWRFVMAQGEECPYAGISEKSIYNNATT